MVAKKSEYQNQFKSSIVKKNHDIYIANLALRTERRDREFMHTPLCWVELSPDDGEVCSDNSEEEVPLANKAKATETQQKEVYQSLAEIMAEAKEKADALRRQQRLDKHPPAEAPKIEKLSMEDVEDINKKVDDKEVADKSLSIYEIVDKENRKLNQKIAQTYVFDKEKGGKCIEVNGEEEVNLREAEIENFSDLKQKQSNMRKTYVKKGSSKKLPVQRPNKAKASGHGKSAVEGAAQIQPIFSSTVPSLSLTSVSSRRPVRPDRKGRISQNKRRAVSSCSTQSKKPPFVSYGAADVEDSLALHRTHNVMAQTDVYQHALQAKIRREEEQRRYREKKMNAQKSFSAEDLLERLSSVGLTPRDDWASEYSLQFHGYEPREYQRAVSARSVLPRAAFSSFCPVRSGGCKIVHVD
ncbi:hypothetical protein PoB_005668800 [Plakobranchus ocellatus]|uniref:Uncharacterized protein n=1 Tax=Plakobranchus ocellatus TaxID=259542 RepID=A0AAV4CFA5_9GAST|nr:hypothetical protein PoB_005668800 [Plakobranchus ocellatus]